MYAIISTGGRQYRVEPGTVLEINRVAGNVGDTLELDNSVMYLSCDGEVQVGTPTVADARVTMEVLEHFRGKKITVFKMKRRKRYRRKSGHRQELTRVAVTDILTGGDTKVEVDTGEAAAE
jgi:large subunit ribosomal protein L21